MTPSPSTERAKRDAMSLESSVAGTVVIWTISAGLSILLALILTAGSLSPRRWIRLVTRACVNCTRGIPTSILVLTVGIAILKLGRIEGMPAIFPATPPGYAPLAWGIVAALAFGSAGHLAEIFRAAHATLGPARLEQVQALALKPARRTMLLIGEAARPALAPSGSRLVHHLHNTAFAALFPVTELFGYVQSRANETFQVVHYVVLGAGIYAGMSALIWGHTRMLELWISRRELAPGSARQAAAPALHEELALDG
jgi:ABC-type amino acid transport system permease subunit